MIIWLKIEIYRVWWLYNLKICLQYSIHQYSSWIMTLHELTTVPLSCQFPARRPRKGKGKGKAGSPMGPWGVERVELPTADRVASRNWNHVCKKVHCVDFCTHESFGLLVLIFFFGSCFFGGYSSTWSGARHFCQGKGKASEAPKGGKSGKGPEHPMKSHHFAMSKC